MQNGILRYIYNRRLSHFFMRLWLQSLQKVLGGKNIYLQKCKKNIDFNKLQNSKLILSWLKQLQKNSPRNSYRPKTFAESNTNKKIILPAPFLLYLFRRFFPIVLIDLKSVLNLYKKNTFFASC